MALPTAVPGLGFVLEDVDLIAGRSADDVRYDLGGLQLLATREDPSPS
jgi:hypothetical protein